METKIVTRNCVNCKFNLPWTSRGNSKTSAFRAGRCVCRDCEYIIKAGSDYNPNDVKKCTNCNKLKNVVLFARGNQCRDCNNRDKETVLDFTKTDKCNHCDGTYTIDCFLKVPKSRLGYERICRQCSNIKSKESRDRAKNYTPEQILEAQKRIFPTGQKWCGNCEKFLDISSFNKEDRVISRLRTNCSNCDNNYYADLRQTMRERNYHQLFSDLVKGLGIQNIPIYLAQKQCCECKEIYPLTQFILVRLSSTPISGRCEKCRHEANLVRHNKDKSYRNEFKSQGCYVCGITDVRVLQLAHLDRKNKKQTMTTAKPYRMNELSPADLNIEKQYVKVLCSVHHRMHTQFEHCNRGINTIQSEPRRIRLDYVNRVKLCIGGCKDCGLKVKYDTINNENNTYLFDFDHLPQYQKILGISLMIFDTNRFTIEHIYHEICKCELVCCNCHHIRTYGREKWGYDLGEDFIKNKRFSIMEHYQRFLDGYDILEEDDEDINDESVKPLIPPQVPRDPNSEMTQLSLQFLDKLKMSIK